MSFVETLNQSTKGSFMFGLGATAASSPPVPIVLTASKLEERPSANFQPKPQFSGGEPNQSKIEERPNVSF